MDENLKEEIEYYVGLDNKEEFEKVSGFASVN